MKAALPSGRAFRGGPLPSITLPNRPVAIGRHNQKSTHPEIRPGRLYWFGRRGEIYYSAEINQFQTPQDFVNEHQGRDLLRLRPRRKKEKKKIQLQALDLSAGASFTPEMSSLSVWGR